MSKVTGPAITMDKKVKGATTGVYFDKYKLAKLCKKFKTQQEFAQTIGRSNTWFFNCMQRGTMAKVDALALKAIYKVDLIIPAPIPEVKEEKPKATIKYNPDGKSNEAGLLLIDKLDEIIITMHKLGNVQMQMLEDLQKITKELTK